jgi:hypothetical protein
VVSFGDFVEWVAQTIPRSFKSRYLMILQKRGAPCSNTPLKAPDSPCGPPQGVTWAARAMRTANSPVPKSREYEPHGDQGGA